MTRLDEIIANALAGIPETDAAILAREVVRLRGATSVVVPEPTMFDVNREYFERFATVFTSQHAREAHKTGFLAGVDWFREHSRAISSDRVLGEGMLSIHPDVLNSISDTLREIGDTAHDASTGPAVPDVLWEIRGKAYEAYIAATDAEAEIVQTANALAALDALCSNQGGADHA